MSGRQSANPPIWTPVLLMAKEWGIPPWQVEEECTFEWLKNWLAYRTAEGMEQERLEKKQKRG
jgi:hypothetical protein